MLRTQLMNMSRRNKKHLQNVNRDQGMVVQHQEVFNGPLPPPVVLEKYNEIIPGAAERIIAMAEEQAKHRKELEVKVINSDVGNSKLGLWFGLIIGLAGLAASVIVIIYGEQIVGGVLGIGTLGSLVGVFVYGSQKRNQERQESRRQFDEK